jgi:hypothetical protein
MIAAVKYSHMRKKLLSLGAPTSTVMDRILEKEKDDVSVEKLRALLKNAQDNANSRRGNAVDSNAAMEFDDR